MQQTIIAIAAAAVILLISALTAVVAAADSRVSEVTDFTRVDSCSKDAAGNISADPNVSYRSVSGVTQLRACAVECAATNSCAVFQLNFTSSLCLLGSSCDLRDRWVHNGSHTDDCHSYVIYEKLACEDTMTGTNGSSTIINPSTAGRTGSVQDYSVPVIGDCYRVQAWGASGGMNTHQSKAGGKGAHVSAFMILSTSTVRIVVGKAGSDEASSDGKNGGGGGGGSFVYTESGAGAELLLAAGGGGGASKDRMGNDADLIVNTDPSQGIPGIKTHHCGGGAGWNSASDGTKGGKSRDGNWEGGSGENNAHGGFGGGGGGAYQAELGCTGEGVALKEAPQALTHLLWEVATSLRCRRSQEQF